MKKKQQLKKSVNLLQTLLIGSHKRIDSSYENLFVRNFKIRSKLVMSATFFPVNKNDEYFNMSASLSDPHRTQKKLIFFATADFYQ